MLLQIYLTISISTTVLGILAEFRGKSRVIKQYRDKHKEYFKENIFKTMSTYLGMWIPILQLIHLVVLIWLLFIASDYEIINFLEKKRLQQVSEKEKLDRIINKDME